MQIKSGYNVQILTVIIRSKQDSFRNLKNFWNNRISKVDIFFWTFLRVQNFSINNMEFKVYVEAAGLVSENHLHLFLRMLLFYSDVSL